ncbi:LacI family transcriptional regulator [Streptomyces adustus]|uniref:LacI family transcriptional regulator n=1 Tax=Streptomyces adustus TaxID=1609272 RepID=A0A5N8V5G1_9ACTN|nr:LacI family DNA-binding transcriptional regulator [Streptomyces adustus]MPY29842.1 LacI family transcriptional regulator [Streptomyces adustus]
MNTIGIKDVALRAGVSIATVSNVLNRPEKVARGTRQRVEDAIDVLGYVPNLAARQLSGSRGSMVGLVVFDVRNPFLTDIARGAEDLLHAEGRTVMLCNTDVLADKEERYLQLLAQQNAAGVLITPADLNSHWLEGLRARGLRVVLLDNAETYPDVCSVAVDDVAGADSAITHLLARGHERIAFITGPMHMRQSKDRLAGSRQALERAGRPAEVLRIVEAGAFTVDQGRRAGEQLLTASERVTAVFCANDLLALGVMQTAFRAKLRVPDDLAIVGYDDIHSAATAGVPLTSVHVGGYDLGKAAAELLLDEDRPGHTHRRLVFPPRLVERNST